MCICISYAEAEALNISESCTGTHDTDLFLVWEPLVISLFYPHSLSSQRVIVIIIVILNI